jgi:hypothetical protein
VASQNLVEVVEDTSHMYSQSRGSLAELAEKLNHLERRYDHQFKVVFDAIREIMNPAQPAKKRRIGFGNDKE